MFSGMLLLLSFLMGLALIPLNLMAQTRYLSGLHLNELFFALARREGSTGTAAAAATTARTVLPLLSTLLAALLSLWRPLLWRGRGRGRGRARAATTPTARRGG